MHKLDHIDSRERAPSYAMCVDLDSTVRTLVCHILHGRTCKNFLTWLKFRDPANLIVSKTAIGKKSFSQLQICESQLYFAVVINWSYVSEKRRNVFDILVY